MFGSRKKARKPYRPPTAATVNPSAATAAVSAYNLSNAAAAAALRALPAAPTDVSAVQTKRTQRRSASLSSEGSRRPLSPVPSIKRVIGLGGSKDNEQRNGRVASPLGIPTLRRRGSASSMRSVSSMSERTFRSPSPHQSRRYANPSITSSPGNSITGSRKAPVNAAAAAAAVATGSSAANSRSRSMPPPPPVPAIPQHVINNYPSSPHEQANTKLKKSRRITTLGIVQPPLKLASQKQQAQGSDRSSWFGPGTVGNVKDIRTSDQPMDINAYARASEDQRPMSPTERPGSRSSLHNFSYPSRQRLSSPPASPTHSRNTSLTESVGVPGAAAAAATAAPLRKTPSIVRSVSTERAPKPHASSKPTGAAATRRSASTSRVPGHSHASSLSDQELVYDPNSRRMVPRGQLMMLEESNFEGPTRPRQHQPQQQQVQVQAQPQQQPRTQRKKKGQQAQAPQKQKPSIAVAASPPPNEDAPAVAPVVAPAVAPAAKQKAAAEELEKPAPKITAEELTSDKIDEVLQPVPALSTSASTPSSSVSSLPALAQLQAVSPAIQNQASPVDSTDHSISFASDDNRPVLVKRPSTVHEDPEREEEEGRNIHSSIPGDSEKSRSRSPLRATHFSSVVTDNLTVRRHSPPPRSISPRKSAMKQTSSPRDTSPSDTASDAASAPYQPPPPSTNAESLRRKKANRVSFDENATVLAGPPTLPIQSGSPTSSLPGAAEAPANSHSAHQPPTRSRSWFTNIGRNKKKTAGDASVEDDDAFMKPRPALPSFGSVRDKPFTSLQQEERALVKPSDNQTSPRLSSVTSSPPPQSALKSNPLETFDSNSDHTIGPIISSPEGLAAASVTRNTANTSRFREPLPPVVTSVDGSGYVSDSGASALSDDDDDLASTVAGDVPVSNEEHSPILRYDEEQDTTVPAPVTGASAVTDLAQERDITQAPATDAALPSPKKTVPAISISHPSNENLVAVRGTDSEDEDDVDGGAFIDASAAAQPSSARSVFDVPGTFPDTDSDSPHKKSPTHPESSNTAVPVRQNAFEPISQDEDICYSPQMPATVFATHMPTLHEEAPLATDKFDDDDDDDDDSEVFSDAYEDLSDIEGDGFLSLDAVVDSPIVPTFSKSPFGSSVLTGSPPRKSDPVPRGPSPFPETASSTEPNTDAAASTVVAGTSITMSTLMASAASKNAGMGNMDPDDKDDWDKVKAFWRSLSAEKRAQLESEAREDAATDGDLEEESSAAKKPRPKKSAETRLAEKRAIQELEAETMTSPVEHKTEAVAATRIRRSMRDKPSAGFAGTAEDKETGQIAPTLRRRGSDSSDSIFMRTRNTGTGFRKSLRGAEPRSTTADTDAITLANTAANENLANRGNRFSLRSLSPTGSTTLRGSAEPSPQFKRTMRDGSGGGFAGSESRRISSPGPMASATLRKGAGSESSGGFFSSLGRKSGGKLLQRSKNTGGGGGKSFSRTRLGDSSDDDDDDVFGPLAGLGNSSRRTANAGAYTFRSRFVDSSDEDEVVAEHRTAPRPQSRDHVVPKSLRGGASTGFSSSSVRPGSSSAPKTASQPDKPAETNQTMSPQPVNNKLAGNLSKPYPSLAPDNSTIGTTTLRRTRSGRGQMVPMSPGYSPTTTGMAGVGAANAPTPTRHRRASSLMSVLRRKKPDNVSSPASLGGIGRGELVESAARRDTQLERNTQELAAVRSSSVGSSQRQRSLNRTLRGGNGNGSSSTPRIMPIDGDESDDLDEDDSEDAPRVNGVGSVGNAGKVNNSWPFRGPGPLASNLEFLNDSASNQGGDSLRQKKKKFPALRRMFRLDD